MQNHLHLVILEAYKSRGFSSSLGKLPFWDHHGYAREYSDAIADQT